jgi:hypothetical protein
VTGTPALRITPPLAAPPIGLLALGLASLPSWALLFAAVGRAAAPGHRPSMTLEARSSPDGPEVGETHLRVRDEGRVHTAPAPS